MLFKLFVILKEAGGNILFFRTVSTFLVRSFGLLLGFALNVLIARYLSIDQAGYYFIAFTVVQVLAVISQIGLPFSILRFIGSSKSDNNMTEASAVYKTSAKWVFSLAIALSILFWLLIDWFSVYAFEKPELGDVFRTILPSVMLLAILNINIHALQALGDSVRSVIAVNIIPQILLIIIILSGLASNALTATLFLSLSYMVAVIISSIWVLSKSGIQWRGIDNFHATSLWESCRPLWWMSIMNLIVQWGSQLIASIYASPEEYANFAVAQRIVFLVSFLLVTANQILAPKYAALYKKGEMVELEKLVLITTKMILLFSLPIVILILMYPQFVLGMFGEEYKAGALVLRILVVGHLLNIATGSVGCLLPMTGHERDLCNVVAFSSIVTVIFSLILIPAVGIVGAALSTTIALASQKLLAVLIVNRRLGFNTLSIWRK